MILDLNRTQPQQYDRITIAHHWIVAFLVIGLWIAGQTIGFLPKGPFRESLWQTHVLVGFALTVVLLSRAGWRLTGGRRLPAVGSPAVRNLAAAVCVCVYVLLFVVVAIGLANAFNRGVDIYGLVKLPQIGDKELKKSLTHYHGLAANILFGLAFFHAAAALMHHFVWKDTVLARMWPGRGAG